jgi:hypothetical protein
MRWAVEAGSCVAPRIDASRSDLKRKVVTM